MSSIPKLALVMAGGRGTRFWPRSRSHRPKQFLAMVGSESLLEATVHRLNPEFPPEHVFVLTTRELAEETRRMLPELPAGNILAEPEGRNTAPCLALWGMATESGVLIAFPGIVPATPPGIFARQSRLPLTNRSRGGRRIRPGLPH